MPGLLAVEGMTVMPMPPVTGGAFTIGPANPYVKIDNKGVYVDGLTITASGMAIPGGSQTAPATFTINSSAQYVTVDNKKVLLQMDKNNSPVAVTFQVGNSTTSVPTTLQITVAGQTSTQEI